MHGGFSIRKSVFFISITLVLCSAAKPYPSSVQRIGKRTIGVMKLHQHFEFWPASQDPFSFCQIQLALDTVYSIIHDPKHWLVITEELLPFGLYFASSLTRTEDLPKKSLS
jgi:hypothetical protein